MSKTTSNNSLVLSYLDLRKAIGIIGLALPFVLVFGKMLFDGSGIQASISAYYYTVMRDVFVGSLCAIGVFLLSYRGYEEIDHVAGNLAFIFAIGTALLPTTPNAAATQTQMLIGRLHIIFAMLLFLTLSFFALFLFRKTGPGRPTKQKLQRNMVYTICGIGMLICIALALVVQLLPKDSVILNFSPIFWLESLAIVLFGGSWFVKGEAILKDEV